MCGGPAIAGRGVAIWQGRGGAVPPRRGPRTGPWVRRARPPDAWRRTRSAPPGRHVDTAGDTAVDMAADTAGREPRSRPRPTATEHARGAAPRRWGDLRGRDPAPSPRAARPRLSLRLSPCPDRLRAFRRIRRRSRVLRARASLRARPSARV